MKSTSSLASPPRHSHGYFIALMVLLCFLWSLSGIVTRQLERAKSWEVTFWRSFFTVTFVFLIIVYQKRGAAWKTITSVGWPGVISGAMFGCMFTCFMLALTMTSTANTMIVNALYPIFAALLGWIVLGAQPPMRTWFAIFASVAGLGYMVWDGVGDGLVGMIIALGVPISAAINVVVMKKFGKQVDLVPAVMIGAALSAMVTLPFALPFQATAKDVSLLAFLGLFQLAIPCAMLVYVSRHLAPAEVALLSLLEVVFAPIWTWIGVNEVPSKATLIGGGIALLAIALNEAVALRASVSARSRTASATG